jgi:hypothetical protein
MFNLGNLAGTIMLEEIPLVKFKFEKDVLLYAKVLCDQVRIMPPEFMELQANERLVRFQNGRCFDDDYWLKTE